MCALWRPVYDLWMHRTGLVSWGRKMLHKKDGVRADGLGLCVRAKDACREHLEPLATKGGTFGACSPEDEEGICVDHFWRGHTGPLHNTSREDHQNATAHDLKRMACDTFSFPGGDIRGDACRPKGGGVHVQEESILGLSIGDTSRAWCICCVGRERWGWCQTTCCHSILSVLPSLV